MPKLPAIKAQVGMSSRPQPPTRMPVHQGQDPEMQTRELREYCERRGWTVAGEYVDKRISGAKDRWSELDRLMADAHKRRFDVVAVWRFDRFARSVSHLLRALDTFRVLGIDFVSPLALLCMFHCTMLRRFRPACRKVINTSNGFCGSSGTMAEGVTPADQTTSSLWASSARELWASERNEFRAPIQKGFLGRLRKRSGLEELEASVP